LKNNVSWKNREDGFHENGGDLPMKMYNNTAWRNGRNSFWFDNSATTFRNNISHDTVGRVTGSQPFNSWTLPVTVNDSDFGSLNDACARGPRQANGSLPNCSFLRLAAGSDLIDKGTNVGIPYTGSAPDLGAFEYGGTSVSGTNPPTVSITASASGATVSGASVTSSANASDNVGVSGVQFKLDGTNVGAEDTTSPYSVTWNSTTATNGSHTLTAVARDAAGNMTISVGASVTVNNTDPPLISQPIVPLTCRGRVANISVFNNTIFGGPDSGTPYTGTLRGTNGNDVIVGTDANDSINGARGNDIICGGAGRDTLRGAQGRDRLFGERGRDRLFGGSGRDLCNGGEGRDKVSGCERLK
jgi:Ca2+-binding RTX toxin-like protein